MNGGERKCLYSQKVCTTYTEDTCCVSKDITALISVIKNKTGKL